MMNKLPEDEECGFGKTGNRKCRNGVENDGNCSPEEQEMG